MLVPKRVGVDIGGRYILSFVHKSRTKPTAFDRISKEHWVSKPMDLCLCIQVFADLRGVITLGSFRGFRSSFFDTHTSLLYIPWRSNTKTYNFRNRYKVGPEPSYTWSYNHWKRSCKWVSGLFHPYKWRYLILLVTGLWAHLVVSQYFLTLLKHTA